MSTNQRKREDGELANGVGRQSLSLPFPLSAKPRALIVAECLISTVSLLLRWLKQDQVHW